MAKYNFIEVIRDIILPVMATCTYIPANKFYFKTILLQSIVFMTAKPENLLVVSVGLPSQPLKILLKMFGYDITVCGNYQHLWRAAQGSIGHTTKYPYWINFSIIQISLKFLEEWRKPWRSRVKWQIIKQLRYFLTYFFIWLQAWAPPLWLGFSVKLWHRPVYININN